MLNTASIHNFSKPLAALIAMLALLWTLPSAALTSSDEIKRLVERQVRAALKQQKVGAAANERLTIQVSAPDPRLRLGSCAQAPKVVISGTKLVGRVTTKVSCAGPTPWSLYVPVNVDIYRKVLVTTAGLARGHVVTRADIKTAEHRAQRLTQGYFQSPARILGKEIKRPLGLGQVITPNALTQPKIIAKGDDVMIMAKSGSLSIRTPGTALMNGRVGQQINVRNKHSKRMVKAQVVRKGLVEVLM